MNIADLILKRANKSGDVTAVRLGGDSLTYAQLAHESDRVAFGLRELGVKRGDRVLMFSANSIEHLITYLATARLGAVFAPVHPSFQSSELAYVLANATPTVVIAQPSLWDRLDRCQPSALPSIRIVLGGERAGLLPFSALGLDASGSVGVADVDDHDPVLVCYTSGTTDRPHPVTRTHANEVHNARAYAEVWDYQAGDRALVALPLSWLWGLSTLAMSLLSAGATVILHVEFDPDDALEEIDASKVSLFAGTMSMYTALLPALQRCDHDLTSLRRLYRGGEPVNNEVVDAIQRRLGVSLTDAYATTEVAPVLAVDPVHDVQAPAGTAGRLVPGARIRIVDTDGNDVPAGEVGEAWLGGQGVMLGYWNEPQVTADRLTAEGWFRSGDLLVEGERGYYFVVGRSADVIIRDGAKIAPAEVESAILGVPGVLDSVAVGVPDEEFGESIVAFLLIEAGSALTVDDVYVHLSDRIARFKLPSRIIFVDELPLWRNQKRDRASIRQLAGETLAGEAEPLQETLST